MRHPDITILTAPAPNAVSRCTVQVAGPPTGISTYYYWIVARYPIGRVVSSPFLVTGAPQTRNAQNYIVVSWTPLPAVLGYDVLRTNTDHLPSAAAADIALTTDLTTPRFLDQGQPLSPYNLAGLTHGAPTDGWAHMNNRDYGEPVLELYPGVHVTKILFPDGTEQDTAAAAGAAGSNGQIQFNDNGEFGASLNLFWDSVNSRLGIDTQTPQGALDVTNSSPQPAVRITQTAPGQPAISATGDISTSGALATSAFVYTPQIVFGSANIVLTAGDTYYNNDRARFSGTLIVTGPALLDGGLSVTKPNATTLTAVFRSSDGFTNLEIDTPNSGSISGVTSISSIVNGVPSPLLLNPLGGNVGIGTTTPAHQLELSTDDAAKPGTNTWTIISDARTKRNNRRFEGDIEIIRRLDPTVSEYNGKCGTPAGARVVSFEAEKLREILPQAVPVVRGKLNRDDKDETDILGINTHEIFFHLLRAVQDIDARLQQLEPHSDAPRRRRRRDAKT